MRRRRPLSIPGSIAALALGAACLTGLLGLALEGRTLFRAAPPAPPASAPASAPVPPVPPVPRAIAPPLDPVAGAAPILLSPPFEVPDGLTIKTETQSVRLAGLEGPWRDAVCFDPDDKLWACGLQARAALYNLVRKDDLVCRPMLPADASPPLVTCTAAGHDIGLALVAKGFARPNVARGSAMQRARDAAESGRLGLWNGGWRIRP